MTKSIRKTLALVLSILMLISAMPMVSFAEETTHTEGDFVYEINGEEATIINYTGTETDVVIPGYIMEESVAVVKIGTKSNGKPVFINNTKITSITLPDTITEILPGSFYGCSKLTSAVIGNGVVTIGDTAFPDSKLETVVIGDGVRTIQRNAFGCATLKTVHFRGTEAQWNAITIEEPTGGNTYLLGAKIDYNYGWNCDDDGCKPVFVAAVEPTCETTGNIEHYACAVCGTITDADGEPLLDEDENPVDVTLPVTHSWVDASCAAPKTCSLCGATEGEALIHNIVEVDAQTPTCSVGGWDAYVYCDREGCDYSTKVEKAPLGHDTVSHEAQEPTCTGIGWDAYETCSRCDYTTYVEIPAHGHNKIQDYYQAPTCEVNGFDGAVFCDICKVMLSNGEILYATGHNLELDETVSYDSTCLTEGYAYYGCVNDNCTYFEDEVLPLSGCNYNTWYVTASPTCTETGLMASNCTVCGIPTAQIVPELGHIDEDADHVCDIENCGAEVGDHIDEDADHACDYGCDVAIGEHSDSATDNDHVCDYGCGDVLEECTDGDDKNHTCDVCGAADITAHTWVDADCDTPKTCSHCDATEGEALSHIEHPHAAQAPTCTAIGWDAYVTCDREGCEYTTYVEKAALTHNLVETAAQAPTCTEIGWDAYVTCDREGCEYTTYVEKAALTHNLVETAAQAPTCTEIGWDAYVTCDREDCDYTTYEEKPALTHDLISVEAQDPTCTAVGWDDYVYCDREDCDYTTYDEIDALGHTEAVLPGTAATCTKAGEEDGVYCEVCDTVLVEKAVIAALGHDFVVDEENSKKVTCEEAGVTVEGCSRCNEKKVTNHEALGHDIKDWVTSEYPTCTEEGLEIGRCANCRKYTKTQKLAKIACVDENGDKKCDMCKKSMEDTSADTPTDTPEDKPENNCSCYCHTTGILRFFLFDIPLLFQRFLGLNKECKCGAVHY